MTEITSALTTPSTSEPSILRHLAGFCLVGGMGFLTELLIVSAVKYLAPEILLYARFISFPPALAVTYILNRTLVFRSHRRIAREATLYTIGQIAGSLLNLSVYMALLSLWSWFIRLPELALACGSAVGLLFNFVWSKFLVFRSQTTHD